MHDERRAVGVPDRRGTTAERDLLRGRLKTSAAISADVEIGQITGVGALRVQGAVLRAGRIEVSARGGEVRRIALAHGVDVKGVQPRGESLRVEHDADDVADLGQGRGAHARS